MHNLPDEVIEYLVTCGVISGGVMTLCDQHALCSQWREYARYQSDRVDDLWLIAVTLAFFLVLAIVLLMWTWIRLRRAPVVVSMSVPPPLAPLPITLPTVMIVPCTHDVCIAELEARIEKLTEERNIARLWALESGGARGEVLGLDVDGVPSLFLGDGQRGFARGPKDDEETR